MSTRPNLSLKTSGDIDASSVTVLSGTATAIAAALDSSHITLSGDEDLSLLDRTIDAASLNALHQATTGVVNASSVSTLTGAVLDLIDSYAASGSGIDGLGNETVKITDKELAATDLDTLNSDTTGVVDASSVTTLTGTLADVKAEYTASGIRGLGNEAVTLYPSLSENATDLNALDRLTSGKIDASAVVEFDGAAADVLKALLSAGITHAADVDVGLTDVKLTAATLNSIDSNTGDGHIDASSLTALSGTAGALATAVQSGDIYGLSAVNLSVLDRTVDAATLNDLDGATTGVVNVSYATTLTGTATDVLAAYDASGNGITGLGNEVVILSDTSVTAADLNDLNSRTTGVVDMRAIIAVTGTLADVKTTYLSTGFSGRGNEAITLDGGTMAAADLNILDSKTTGVINVGAPTVLSGSVGAVSTALHSAGISGLAAAQLDVTGTAGADSIVGGSQDDTLTGGGGADVFVFSSAPNAATNVDTITDFAHGTDHIYLAQSVMAALDLGALTSDAFYSATNATAGHDATDRVIYNTTTGALYYDADGNGTGAAVQIATLTGQPLLDNGDFFVI